MHWGDGVKARMHENSCVEIGISVEMCGRFQAVDAEMCI